MADRVATIHIKFNVDAKGVAKEVKNIATSINAALSKAQAATKVKVQPVIDPLVKVGIDEIAASIAGVAARVNAMPSVADKFDAAAAPISRFTDLLTALPMASSQAAGQIARVSEIMNVIGSTSAAETIARISERMMALGTSTSTAIVKASDFTAWTNVLPAASGKVESFGSRVRASLSNIGITTKSALGVAVNSVVAFSGTLGGAIAQGAAKATAAIMSVATGITQFGKSVGSIPTKIAAGIYGIVKAIGQMGAVKNVILPLGSAFWQAMTANIKAATTVLRGFSGVLSTVGKVATSPLRALSRGLGDVGKMMLAMAGFTGLRSIARDIRNLVKEAGPMESVRVQFANFLQQATQNVPGFSSGLQQIIKDMRDMTGGALDTTTMLKNANIAFSLIGDNVGKDLPKMMAVAQAASLSTGQDLTYMFESLVKGVGRLSTRWIDNLGISINLSQVTKDYAATLGKTSGQLTTVERTQALLNATMKEGEKILAKTGNMSVFVSTQMSALSANMRNIRDSAIAAFSPFVTVLLGYVNTFLADTTPKIEQWGDSFVRAFARMPSVFEENFAKLRDVNMLPEDIARKAADTMTTAQNEMGARASDWATNALTWGANVGSTFVSGIITGFAQMITIAMNFISNTLANWLSPGSPPRVAPNIDAWGMATMGEWVDGMLSYPVDKTLMPDIKSKLAATLKGPVDDALFQYGVDSIAEWAKGLATIDLEFLQRGIESALDAAKRVNEELTKSYKGQTNELFKLQVLNKDPAAIRAKIGQVKQTKKALKASAGEIKQLELRKDLLEDQLKLFRLLERALDAQTAALKRAAAAKKAGGAGADDTDLGIEFPIAMPLAGTADLEARVKGIRDRLEEILSAPLDKVKTAWANAFGENGTVTLSFSNFKDTILESAPKIQERLEAFKKAFNETFSVDIELFKKSVQEAFAVVAEEIGRFESASGPTLGESVVKVIAGIGSGIVKGLGYMLAGALQIIRGVVTIFTGNIFNGLGLIIGGAFQIIVGGVRGIIEGLGDTISAAAGTTWEETKRVWLWNIHAFAATVILAFTNFIAGFRDFVDKWPLGKVLGKIFPERLDFDTDTFRAAGKSIVDNIMAGVTEAAPQIDKIAPTLDAEMDMIFKSMGMQASTSASQAQTQVQSSMQTLFSGAMQTTDLSAYSMFGQSIGSSLSIGIEEGMPLVQSSLKLIGTAPADLFNYSTWQDFGVGIPSSVGEGIDIGSVDFESSMDMFGESIPRNIAGGIDNGLPGLQSSLDLIKESLDFNILDTGYKEFGEMLPTDIGKGIELATPKLESALEILGKSIPEGMITGIEDTQDDLISSLGMMLDALRSSAADKLGSNSPSTVYAEFGKSIDDGLARGITANKQLIVTAIKQALDNVLAAAAPYEERFRVLGETIMISMANVMIEVAENPVYGFVKVGNIIAESMVFGIEQRMGYLLAYIREVARRTIKQINTSYGIDSPSKAFAEVGENMTAGLAQGVSGMANILPQSVLDGSPVRGAPSAAGGGAVNVNLYGPIVENMVVPDMRTGREVSRQISQDIGRMAMAQRTPA